MRPRLPLIALSTVALVGFPAFSQSFAATSSVSPADIAATHAYLQAAYTYEQAVVANAGASKAAFESTASTIGAECPGVLANAPPQRFALFAGPQSPRTARAIGEANRRERQLNELEDELDEAPQLAFQQPNRQAAATFASALAPLSWSNPKITKLVQQSAAGLKQLTALALPAVCADMRAWVASDYRTLSPATKQFLSEFVPLAGGALAPLLLGRLMKPYEGPAEKILMGKIRQAIVNDLISEGKSFRIAQLSHTLGIPSSFSETLTNVKTHRVVIGHGRTAVGESYTVSAVETSGSRVNGDHPKECQVEVEIKVHRDNGVNFSSGSSVGGCQSPRGRSESSVNCNEGLLTIRAFTLPRTRHVVLHLSNGRTIDSRPVLLRRGQGGPGGLYYQVVRGPSPIPVSLAELDAHGRTMRREKLNRIVECTKPTLRYLPGGLRTLVHDTVPQGGPAFSIVGQHYRFLGHTYFEATLQMGPTGEERPFGTGGSSESLGTIVFVGPGSSRRPGPFSRKQQTGCQPHPYAIVYGLLKAPGATVMAKVNGKTQELRRIPIPKSMHTHDTLVYGVLPTLPEELLIRSTRGKTIFTENLGSAGKEATETCEGEAEG